MQRFLSYAGDEVEAVAFSQWRWLAKSLRLLALLLWVELVVVL